MQYGHNKVTEKQNLLFFNAVSLTMGDLEILNCHLLTIMAKCCMSSKNEKPGERQGNQGCICKAGILIPATTYMHADVNDTACTFEYPVKTPHTYNTCYKPTTLT